jgi:hypothetical protein
MQTPNAPRRQASGVAPASNNSLAVARFNFRFGVHLKRQSGQNSSETFLSACHSISNAYSAINAKIGSSATSAAAFPRPSELGS